MTFEEYQDKSRATAIYPEVGNNFIYPTLGLVGEAGEVAEKVKKVFRDDKGIITDTKREELTRELGDVLWYMTQLSSELGLKVEDIAQDNLVRLQSRKERGVLGGSGDTR